MNSIALSRHWFLAGSVLLFAWGIHQSGSSSQSGALRTPVVPVAIQETIALVDAGALVIDVRDRSVSAGSHLPGALLIPLEVVAAQLGKMEIAKAQRIVVYCGQGTGRGPAAVQALVQAGFTNVTNLEAGIEGWRAAGLPTLKS
jgi:rhodanese-related sulfurtransferase